MIIVSQAATHRGVVRALNEDALLSMAHQGIWAVADGMGGHDGGDVASGSITRILGDMKRADRFEDSLRRMELAIQEANARLIKQSISTPRHRRPGSTVIALLIQDDSGGVVWAGDSRLYRLRDGSIEMLSRDHSQVQDLVDQGAIAAEDAEEHPLAHVITRAIGFDKPARIETRSFEIAPGDRFLLCSDGLTRVVSDEEICATLADTPLSERPRSLIDLTLSRGAPDNVTVVCVDCDA